MTVLHLSQVSVHYGDIIALDEVTLTAEAGDIVVLTGPNGAGKSTLLSVASGSAPSSGDVTVLGKDPSACGPALYRRVGVIFEGAPLWPDMFVADVLADAAAARGLFGETARNAITTVVEEGSLREVLGQPVRQLSRGYRQRVAWAIATLHRPALLLLDEPTTGLDEREALEVWSRIERAADGGCCVVVSTHDHETRFPSQARIAVLERGQLSVLLDAAAEADAHNALKKK